jgi:hypothetical protein
VKRILLYAALAALIATPPLVAAYGKSLLLNVGPPAVVAGSSQTIAITTPSTQAASVGFNIAGTYASTAPTGVDYQVDSGSFAALSSPTIGTGSWTSTAADVSISGAGSHTVTVREEPTTSVTATSGSFTVLVYSTWNPSDNSNLTLTNGNLTASAATTVSTFHSIRGTLSHTGSVKEYFEYTAGAMDTNHGFMMGIANSTASLTTFLGAGTNGYSMQCDAGADFYYNGAFTSNGMAACVVGHVMAVAVDIGAKKIWVADLTAATGWNVGSGGTQDPGTGAGGISISGVTAPLFIGFSGYDGTTPDTVTLNVGATSFTGTIPSGFSAWD